MRKTLVTLAIVVAAVGLWPRGAHAGTWSSCPNVLNVCVDFTLLYYGGDTWGLTTKYGAGSGFLTATGIYYDGKPAPDFGLTNLSVTTAGGRAWTLGACDDLNLRPGTTVLLGACGSSDTIDPDGIYSGGGGGIFIRFTANDNFRDAYYAGTLKYRGFVEGYGPTGCSVGVDTGVQGNLGTDCVPITGNPEPLTMVLLAGGLSGLAVPAMRRLRKKEEEV